MKFVALTLASCFSQQHPLRYPSREIAGLFPYNQRQHRTCYALCHILHLMLAAQTIFSSWIRTPPATWYRSGLIRCPHPGLLFCHDSWPKLQNPKPGAQNSGLKCRPPLQIRCAAVFYDISRTPRTRKPTPGTQNSESMKTRKPENRNPKPETPKNSHNPYQQPVWGCSISLPSHRIHLTPRSGREGVLN